MRQLIVKNFWLKMLALLLAFVAWLYVVAELGKGTQQETSLIENILPYKVDAKEIPIKINLIGNPPAGYRVLNEKILVRPSSCVLIGPKGLLKKITYIPTEEIDIGKFTRSVSKDFKIQPTGVGVLLEKSFFVSVTIPVEKIEQPQAQEAGVKK